MKQVILGVVILLSFVGCGEADKLFDCQSVCSRYETCFDKSYDVGACRNRCKDKADADKSYQTKADACEACIDDKSCTAAAFQCPTQCVGIVP